jgi:hypothetical protein
LLYDAQTHPAEVEMFLIVHLLALILFWPALFITVPLHIISSQMKPAQPKKSNFTQLSGGFVATFLGGLILVLVWVARNPTVEPAPVAAQAPAKAQASAQPQAPAAPPTAGAMMKAIKAQEGNYVYDMAAKTAQRLIDLHPESAEAKAAKGMLPKLQELAAQQVDFTIQSDPGGKFRQLLLEGPYTARKIITRREGASGITYTTRLYNCQTGKFTALGSSETPESMRASKVQSRLADRVPGSIADVVGDRACAKR